MTTSTVKTNLREDAIIGFVFSTFFALGLLLVSLNPTSVNVQSILFGNILGIDDADILQVQIIVGISLLVLCVIWPCWRCWCWRWCILTDRKSVV